MKEKQIILAARAISMVFTPFYLPLVGLAALFTFSYMSLLPWQYKAVVLLTVYVFTILLPSLLIRTYRRYQGWTLTQLGIRERRMVPYIIAIICYFACYYLMNSQRIPQFMSNILVAALVIQIVCAIINVWWKISTHTAAIGGFAGALLAFSILFAFNPLWCRHGRQFTHDIAPAQPLTSRRRFPRRSRCRLRDDYLIVPWQ